MRLAGFSDLVRSIVAAQEAEGEAEDEKDVNDGAAPPPEGEPGPEGDR